MDIASLEIPDVKLVTPRQFGDDRGSFSETYNRKLFQAAGIDVDFCQDNFSLSTAAGTVRGLHFQAPPFAQTKLVRVLRGSIVDVAVDIRKKSATYGKWVKATLTASNRVQILLPQGFLHGFITLEPNTEVAYKVDNFYDQVSDGSVLWNDPDLNIDWGMGDLSATLSDKDKNAVRWADFETPFD